MKKVISIKKRKLNKDTKELTEAQLANAALRGSNEISKLHHSKNQQQKRAVEEYTEWE